MRMVASTIHVHADLLSTALPEDDSCRSWQETGLYPGQYLDANAQLIYFAGTDPCHRGFPPPEDENELGNPREQWERVHGSVD